MRVNECPGRGDAVHRCGVKSWYPCLGAICRESNSKIIIITAWLKGDRTCAITQSMTRWRIDVVPRHARFQRFVRPEMRSGDAVNWVQLTGNLIAFASAGLIHRG